MAMTDNDFKDSAGTLKYSPGAKARNNTFVCAAARFYQPVKSLEWALSYGPTICADNEPDSYSPSRWGSLTYCRNGSLGSKLGYTMPKRIGKVPGGSVLVNEQFRNEYGKSCSDNGYSFPSYTNDLTAYPRAGTDFCHAGSANFLLVDGHVEGLKSNVKFDTNWRLK